MVKEDNTQCDYNSYLKAHGLAIENAENKVNNSQRINKDLPSSKYTTAPRGGGITGNVDQIYIQSGVKYIVSVTLNNGNVTNVNITPVSNDKKWKNIIF